MQHQHLHSGVYVDGRVIPNLSRIRGFVDGFRVYCLGLQIQSAEPIVLHIVQLADASEFRLFFKVEG